MKNKKALEENSLVNLSSNRPDLYTPTSLPFFGAKDEPNKPK